MIDYYNILQILQINKYKYFLQLENSKCFHVVKNKLFTN